MTCRNQFYADYGLTIYCSPGTYAYDRRHVIRQISGLNILTSRFDNDIRCRYKHLEKTIIEQQKQMQMVLDQQQRETRSTSRSRKLTPHRRSISRGKINTHPAIFAYTIIHSVKKRENVSNHDIFTRSDVGVNSSLISSLFNFLILPRGRYL